MVLKNIKVLPETHKRLSDFGHKSETFDELFNRLVDIAEGKR
jgi:hypothetical protein